MYAIAASVPMPLFCMARRVLLWTSPGVNWRAVAKISSFICNKGQWNRHKWWDMPTASNCRILWFFEGTWTESQHSESDIEVIYCKLELFGCWMLKILVYYKGLPLKMPCFCSNVLMFTFWLWLGLIYFQALHALQMNPNETPCRNSGETMKDY